MSKTSIIDGWTGIEHTGTNWGLKVLGEVELWYLFRTPHPARLRPLSCYRALSTAGTLVMT